MIKLRNVVVGCACGLAGLVVGLAIRGREPENQDGPTPFERSAPIPSDDPGHPQERVPRPGWTRSAASNPEPDPRLEACELEARLLRGQLRAYEGVQ
jgi:hypothetical protein